MSLNEYQNYMQNNVLKKNIMRRVYTIYILRTVARPLMMARPLMIELAIVAALIMSVAFFVSLQNVFQNALQSSNLVDFWNFIIAAFTNTQAIVQVLSVIVLGGIITVVWDLVRRIKHVMDYRLEYTN
jgi:hypothetical protein